MEKRLVNIVFDGPPGNEAGRFVEVENENGHSISFGEWIEYQQGYWALTFENPIDRLNALEAENAELREAAESYRALNVCYRVGTKPSENLFALLKKADVILAKHGGHR